MNFGNDWTIILTLTNGHKKYNRAIKLRHEDIFSGMTPRTMETLELAAMVKMQAMSTETVVGMVEKKEFRRGTLKKIAVQLFMDLADHLEDYEGWNGGERSDKARQNVGEPPY